MDIGNAISTILSLSGLSTSDTLGEAALFRFGRVNVNLGLINTERLSLQLQVVHHHSPYDSEIPGKQFPPSRTEPAEIEEKSPARPVKPAVVQAPIKVSESPFDMSSTFRFKSSSVFDERRIVINTIPIHFLKARDRVLCDMKLRKTFASQNFETRNGRLSMEEGYFSHFEPPAADPPRLTSHDKRLDNFTRHHGGRFYTDRRFLLVGIFSIATGRKVPIGKDDAVFPRSIFGAVHLVCVAVRRRRDSECRLRSHFYIAIERDGTLPEQKTE